MMIDLESIRRRWDTEGTDSDLGLWWLADDVREVLGDNATEDEVCAATIEAVRPLLESGKLQAADLLEGGQFETWSGDIDQQIARIVEGWQTVGKPTIGDVVWFVGNRS